MWPMAGRLVHSRRGGRRSVRHRYRERLGRQSHKQPGEAENGYILCVIYALLFTYKLVLLLLLFFFCFVLFVFFFFFFFIIILF